jgi:ligand-binding SRPBCC domain-containing protein
MHKLSFSQFLPVNRQEAWEFFSSPHNLSVITPKQMRFKIQSCSGGAEIHEGQIISYRVTVLPLMRVNWETEIIRVSKYLSFTDIQRKGPYSAWTHKHSFIEKPGGLEVRDEIEYEVPLGTLGKVINNLVVAEQVQKIFKYRAQVLSRLFKG